MPKKPIPRRTRSLSTPIHDTEPHALSRLLAENAPLSSRQQLLLMYSHFQADMPTDGQTPIATWVQHQLRDHGMPSLLRFGPRHKPQVFRKDEFFPWFQPFLGDPR